MIREQINIKVEKTARLIHLKESEQRKPNLLICLHGYSQLSTFFSNKFEALLPLTDVLVLEGLHRFYLQGTSGRVGASWMTKEERETDIEDNNAYLRKIIDKYKHDYTEINLLGFSQGGATACRFVCLEPTINKFILVASVLPPDIEIPDLKNIKTKKYFVLGTQDEYFNEKTQKEVITLHRNLNFEIHQFDGKHEINISEIQKCLKA